MNQNQIYIGQNIFSKAVKSAAGEIIQIDNEEYFKISDYDSMPPFLMNIVNESDLWMFISSNGALTAGRKNPDRALFPYYTDDRIHDSNDITGSKTILLVTINEKTFLWEPFSSRYSGLYKVERALYKNKAGSKIIFEENNLDLSLCFKYSWTACDKFGFIKKSEIVNNGTDAVHVNVLDGIQNILPSGTDRKFQLEYSTLLDGYKRNELLEQSGLGLFTLSSIPTDKAEPSEALRAATVWSTGLDNALILLSSLQVGLFEQGLSVVQETDVKATRGAYFLQSEFDLLKEKSKTWYFSADVFKDQSDVVSLSSLICSGGNLAEQIEKEILINNIQLNLKIGSADGFQLSNDQRTAFRHFSNVLFNSMRGGIFDENYSVDRVDFSSFVENANRILKIKYATFLENLPDKINIDDLIERVGNLRDEDFEKLCYEYLPLTFSRRHGDPSRPWNLFSIDIKDEHGNKILNYQGNWRDIFQNWEALAMSFPGYIENMVVKFANASTADGYNPYKVTREGFDWEVLDLTDPWSYIGYWGDHQIVYLYRLLELSYRYHPEVLKSFLQKEIFAYANVPYRIKSYDEIVKDPHNTILFDEKLNSEIHERVKNIGADGKYIFGKDGKTYRVNFSEKILVAVLSKLSNFIPEAGIWMNTQRPEWNDANNALVGFGTSMVTLYYLRKFIEFGLNLFGEVKSEKIKVSEEVFKMFSDIKDVMERNKNLLSGQINDIDRKRILDKLGNAGSEYRLKIYSQSFSGKKEIISAEEIISFLQLALKYIEHSIKGNKREDDLYHSYNLIKITENGIIVRRLYEMLEGQVAVLSSGYLSVDESISLLDSLKKSRLYRKDQSSYILYPFRNLPRFMEKNIIPNEAVAKSAALQKLIKDGDKRIVVCDIKDGVHFNSKLRNAALLKNVLNEESDLLEKINGEQQFILDLYEKIFDHQSFTGRSGTFYKYEGLGSIYWHMVSKLLLAVQDVFFKAAESGKEITTLGKLKNHYCEIKNGIGIHKSPALYGAFPTDPYSHTPSNAGAQQPGMTGQVKEDIISRLTELGVRIHNCQIEFNSLLIDENEFLTKSRVYEYYDVNGRYQTLMLNPGMLAFTLCQVPVVYIISKADKIIVTKKDNSEEEIDGHVMSQVFSKMIFKRENNITRIKVLINK
jgi:hypothetical protein